jgi:hypothetical protein
VPPTFADGILETVDSARAERGRLGLAAFRVYLRIREWSGQVVGEGEYVDNAGNNGRDFQITVGQPPIGPQPVKVVFVSTKDIIASAGLYRDRDMKVGPFTPPYGLSQGACCAAGFGGHGGISDAQIDPAQFGNTATQIFWRVEGPTMGQGGAYMTRIELSATALHYFMTLRANGAQPGP